MKTFWFYGDSYTGGFGVRPAYAYYHLYKGDLPKKSWPELVSEYFNAEDVNRGVDGSDNNNILDNILTDLPFFNENDMVFISLTFPVRFPLYNHSQGRITFASNNVFTEKREHEEKYLDVFFNSDKEKHLMLDYINTFIVPYNSAWSAYYLNRFHLIQKILKDKKIQTYIWSSEQEFNENNHQTIKECISRVDDDHWSFLGHKQFADKVVQNIEQKKYYHIKKEFI